MDDYFIQLPFYQRTVALGPQEPNAHGQFNGGGKFKTRQHAEAHERQLLGPPAV